MNPLQFTTRSLLLAVTFAAVWLGGVLAMPALSGESWSARGYFYAFWLVGIYSPLWIQFVVLGFACGRRRLSVPIVVALAVAECIALFYAYFAIRHEI